MVILMLLDEFSVVQDQYVAFYINEVLVFRFHMLNHPSSYFRSPNIHALI